MEKRQQNLQKTSANGANGKGNHNHQNGRTEKTHSMLQTFFLNELKDIYWAEKHLVAALPKMQKAATDDELVQAFTDHLAQTKNHVQRLEQIFEMLDVKAQPKKCEAMEGLIKENETIIETTSDGTFTRDAGLILGAQKIEHYEIATYGGLAQLARTMEMKEITRLLEATLEEEKESDYQLTDIAENKINSLSLEETEA